MIEAIRIWFAPPRQRRACSFPGLLYALVVGLIVAGLFVLTASSVRGQEVDTQRAALVHVGDGGSGVCVSPDGYIFTAAHCVADLKYPHENWRGKGPAVIVPKKSVKVRFPNQEPRTAAILLIWWIDKRTDLALISVEGSGLPYLRYSGVSPKVGEPVTSIGYPANHFARFESDVTFVGTTNTSDGPIDLIQTSHRVSPGHSGGPLLNKRGQVCGISSMGSVDAVGRNGQIQQTEQISLWARCEYFEPMLKQAGATVRYAAQSSRPKPIVDVWFSINCAPCHTAFNDAKSLRINYRGEAIDKHIELVAHDFDSNRAEAMQAGIKVLPTFVIRATGEKIEGYQGPDAINIKVGQILTLQVQPEPGVATPPATEDPPAPITLPAPISRTPQTPEATAADAEPEKIDATGVRVVLLVKKQDVGILQGTAISVIEKFAETGVKKKINTALGGKADIDLVFQRTKPKRFTELLEAVGVESVKRNAVIVVLIPKQFTGVVGNVAKLVEDKLKALADGDWKYSTVVTLAERIDPDGYQAALDAAEQEESTESTDAGEQSWLAYLITGVMSAAAGTRDAILGHKVKKAAA